MPTWTQIYDPFGHWWLSALVAALPIIVLFTLMAGFRVKPHWSALAGAATAILVANLVFHMPLSLAGGSFLFGVSTGIAEHRLDRAGCRFSLRHFRQTGEFEIMK